MVNIPYHASRLQSRLNRSIYSAELPLMVKSQSEDKATLPVDVYSFSCERDLPEQAASLFSFLRYVGVPENFNIVSDGSYTERSRALLEKISPCVKIVNLEDIVRQDVPVPIKDYAAVKVLGKKLAMLWSLQVSRPIIYTDADILFFKAGHEIAEIIRSDEERPWFLPDTPGALDAKLLVDKSEEESPINSGFILFKKPLNWDLALNRLENRQGAYDYFTEQTTIHLTLHQSCARPFSAERFIVQRDDQFKFQDAYASKNIALRHYVGPVRHKFWHDISWR